MRKGPTAFVALAVFLGTWLLLMRSKLPSPFDEIIPLVSLRVLTFLSRAGSGLAVLPDPTVVSGHSGRVRTGYARERAPLYLPARPGCHLAGVIVLGTIAFQLMTFPECPAANDELQKVHASLLSCYLRFVADSNVGVPIRTLACRSWKRLRPIRSSKVRGS
jgi:hypothetical protein